MFFFLKSKSRIIFLQGVKLVDTKSRFGTEFILHQRVFFSTHPTQKKNIFFVFLTSNVSLLCDKFLFEIVIWSRNVELLYPLLFFLGLQLLYLSVDFFKKEKKIENVDMLDAIGLTNEILYDSGVRGK